MMVNDKNDIYKYNQYVVWFSAMVSIGDTR